MCRLGCTVLPKGNKRREALRKKELVQRKGQGDLASSPNVDPSEKEHSGARRRILPGGGQGIDQISSSKDAASRKRGDSARTSATSIVRKKRLSRSSGLRLGVLGEGGNHMLTTIVCQRLTGKKHRNDRRPRLPKALTKRLKKEKPPQGRNSFP